MNKELVIGTRGSALALWQAEYVKARLYNECDMQSRIQIIKTKGDKILDVPLAKIGGKGLFTKELEEMLLSGAIDIAVHSLKDVPVDMVDGLELAAITEREDSKDCMLSMQYNSLFTLPKNAKIGTTSLRRSMQIGRLRADVDTMSLRGNVQTRLQKLKNGEFDAIILARAGVKRLGINTQDVAYITDLDALIPAMGQGALGIQMHKNSPYFALISRLNHPQTALCVSAERAFVRTLNGGCQVPIGVYANYADEVLTLKAIVGLPNGSEIIEECAEMPISKAFLESQSALPQDMADSQAMLTAQNLGVALAQSFINKGAKELLLRAEKMAFNT